MTKKGFFLTAMLLLCTFHASAKNHVKEQLLANVFKSLSSAPTAIVTDVSYTGDFQTDVPDLPGNAKVEPDGRGANASLSQATIQMNLTASRVFSTNSANSNGSFVKKQM